MPREHLPADVAPKLQHRLFMRPIACLCTFVLSIVACEVVPGNSNPASPSDIAAACSAVTAYDQKCDRLGGRDPAAVTATCTARSDTKFLREDGLQFFTTCVRTLDCGTLVDTCMAAAVQNLGIKPDEDLQFKNCQAKAAACGTFVDDVCGSALLFTTYGRSQLDVCLTKPCADAGVCVKAL